MAAGTASTPAAAVIEDSHAVGVALVFGSHAIVAHASSAPEISSATAHGSSCVGDAEEKGETVAPLQVPCDSKAWSAQDEQELVACEGTLKACLELGGSQTLEMNIRDRIKLLRRRKGDASSPGSLYVQSQQRARRTVQDHSRKQNMEHKFELAKGALKNKKTTAGDRHGEVA